MDNSKLKKIYERLKLHLCVSKIIIDLFEQHLKLGNITKLISFKRQKYETCPSNYPSEYFSNNNLLTEAKILTDNDEIFTIKEEYLGLNFEEPCDDYILTIFDKNNNIVGTTKDLDNYNAKIEETKKKIKSIKNK